MSFIEVIEKYNNFDFNKYFNNVTADDIKRSIYKNKLDEEDLLNLISPKAERHLEEMARKANELTNRYFGKAILLYTPMSVSYTHLTYILHWFNNILIIKFYYKK